MLSVEPDDIHCIVDENAVNPPEALLANLELPCFMKGKLIWIDSGESIPLGRPIKIDYMSVLVIILIAKLFDRPTAVLVQPSK